MLRSLSQIRRVASSGASTIARRRGLGVASARHSSENRLRSSPCGIRQYCGTLPKFAETVTVTYVEADGSKKEVQAEIGKNLMDVAHDNNIELEGACGGELACSTCHLIFEQDIYDTLPEKDDEEDDMLDLAFEVTETSRLGCQVLVKENMEGMTVKIPDDGF